MQIIVQQQKQDASFAKITTHTERAERVTKCTQHCNGLSVQ